MKYLTHGGSSHPASLHMQNMHAHVLVSIAQLKMKQLVCVRIHYKIVAAVL